MKWSVVVSCLLASGALAAQACPSVEQALKVTHEIGRQKMNESNAAFQIDTLASFETKHASNKLEALTELLHQLKKHDKPLFKGIHQMCAIYGASSIGHCARLIHDHYFAPEGSFHAWLHDRRDEHAYAKLSASEATELAKAVETIRNCWRKEASAGSFEYQIVLNSLPQFIHNAISIAVAKDNHHAVLTRYDWGREDD